MKSPVLFMIFKREDTTQRVFERIREAKPPRLYIAADGPRANRPDEVEKCKATRKAVENVDWPCEVFHLYREENLGCGKGVSSAITWFFDNEEQGIIIEDDILAHVDFFRYCDEMLEIYKEDESVQLISGNNYFYDGYESKYSYYKSVMMNIWGWASWRRVWKSYQFDVSNYSEKVILQHLNDRFPDSMVQFYMNVYNQMRHMAIDTWDYQLFMNQVYYDRYSIAPFNNMIQNIGFDDSDATHTKMVDVRIIGQKSLSPYPLIHPSSDYKDRDADLVAITNTEIKQPSILRRVFCSIIGVLVGIFRKGKQ